MKVIPICKRGHSSFLLAAMGVAVDKASLEVWQMILEADEPGLGSLLDLGSHSHSSWFFIISFC